MVSAAGDKVPIAIVSMVRVLVAVATQPEPLVTV